MTKDKEIEVIDKRHTAADVPAVQEDSPNAVLMMAIQKNYDPALIEKMMDLQERQKAGIAREAFVDAKAAFKAEAPIVIKDLDNKQYGSKYASEDALFNTINPVLSRHGLDISFAFPKVETGLAVTCILMHKLGHSESVTLSGPLDTSGSKNPLQGVKSTVTYLRKATFEAITGIASGNKDDDGNDSEPKELITTDQATVINDLIKETSSNLKIFLKHAEVDNVKDIPQSKYEYLVGKLNKKKAGMRQPGEQ